MAPTKRDSDAAVLGEGQNPNYRSFPKQLGNIGDLLAAANQPIGKNGLSAAARKLSSHAQRKGGTFDRPTGNIQQQNAFAEKTLKNILENPASKRTELSRGGHEIQFNYTIPPKYNSIVE